jgi:uncharacterized protein YbjQ (UPF0145 family)
MTNALIQQSADLANRPDSMLITTTPSVPGYRVTAVKGIVRGNTVRARNVGRDIVAAFKSLVGGEISEYTKLMAESREQALDRMRAEAAARGANAVIGVEFVTAMIMQGASEILVAGTAVVLEPLDS